MEYVYTIGSDGELYHWGIKGMKWGIRRYQNKDGSLTPAGKKRYGSDVDSSDATTTPKKKSVSEMSDDEIRSAIARKQLENQYSQLHPQAAKQESFIKKFVDQAVKPAAINAGRDFIEKSLKKVTGDILKDKVDPNSLEGLEAANKKLRAQIANKWLKKGIDTTANWESAAKQYKLQNDMNADANAKGESKKSSTDNNGNSGKQKQTESASDKKNPNTQSSKDRVYEGEVVGEGKSSRKNESANKTEKKSQPDIIDMEVSNLPATYTSYGRNYVDSILDWDDD